MNRGVIFEWDQVITLQELQGMLGVAIKFHRACRWYDFKMKQRLIGIIELLTQQINYLYDQKKGFSYETIH